MGKLTDDQEKTLNDLLNLRDAKDDEDDFEIEIFDNGKGARIPYSRGREYLQKHFGIDLDPSPDSGKPDNGKPDNGTGDGGSDGKGAGKGTGSKQSVSGRYFGNGRK